VRDHAILMLFAVYGLRSGEVRRLSLQDLDWTKEVISV
jgi:integrase